MAEITIVGGINIDIEGLPTESLVTRDSNPGRISITYGGVGRNITENVARVGGDVALISVVGDDHMGAGAIRQLKELGVETSGIDVIRGQNSCVYLSVLDETGDMKVAINDMDIIKEINSNMIGARKAFFKNAKVICLDANLEEDIIKECLEMFPEKKFFLDPVSAAKAVKAKDVIGKFYAIKPNVYEAEILSGMKIENNDDLKKAAEYFIQQGVSQVYISLGKDGVYYNNGHKDGFIKSVTENPVSATGAGDSFSAMILTGIAENKDIEEIAQMGMAAASITMESKQSVNVEMDKDEIIRRIKAYV